MLKDWPNSYYGNEGDIFPAIPSDTTKGLTLWQWDGNQRDAS